ncbi:hypothetical protein COX00_00495 [Candidatus Uhrbacteria bacterium CG22_combo_CG10-13_8_21_14_all_47_17]|uniref:Baseplate protein J-like domain-containing protein n=1 Tax=Candidatus Uhrbacteria bacterium CG22_combo_CG10-13_8_21_14_all_47_17 TaxID=1975041 RepID=A0A2H0BTD8_9BACT|nr:MAG: hypothetical protein COX00_00495 [Candidatus Uhrbacteria bacterium CG22_combo_CG10-13_8_21_14_all_47_17]
MNPRSRRPGAVRISAPSFPTSPHPSIYRKIAYTFLGLTVVIVIAVLWLTSVKAEVLIKTTRQTVSLDGTVEVAKTPAQGQIPGRVVQGTFEKIQEFFVATSTQATSDTAVNTPVETTQLPDNQVRARGKVRIINEYSKTQPLVRTTRLLTPDNKLYRIDKSISVPPGGEVEVEAYADQTGYDLAIGPSKFTIPGLYEPLQQYIYAISDAPFTVQPISQTEVASTDTVAPQPVGEKVKQSDLDSAEKTLMDVVLARAKTDLATEAGNPENMETVYVVKVVDQKTNATVGQVTESFLSSLKLEVTAVYYSKEDMRALVRSKLRERVPEGNEFLPTEASSASYSLESADLDNEVASIRIKADGSYHLSPNNALLQPSVFAGKSKDEVVTLLHSVDGVESIDIVLHPSWLRNIPSFKDKIKVTVE